MMKNNLKKKIRSSLLLQLLILATVIVCFLLCTFIYTSRYAKKIIKNNTLELNKKILQQLEGKAEEYYKTLQNEVTSFAYTPTTNAFFMQTPLERLVNREKLSVVFSNVRFLEADIAGIYLYDMNMKQLAGIGDNIEIAGIENQFKVSNLLDIAKKRIFTICYPVYNLNSTQYGKQIGMCVLALQTEKFKVMLASSQVTANTQVYIIDGNNQIVATTSTDEILNLEDSMMVNGNGYYVQIRAIRMEGWRVVSRIPEKELYSSSDNLEDFITVSYILAVLLIILLLLFCYYNLFIRLHKVDLFIKGISKQPHLQLKSIKEDEIGTIIHNLNQMLTDKERMNQEIQKSQKQMYEINLSQKQLQVLAFRNQINPHFLYNTFECICGMALYYGVDDISEITMALSNVFRYATHGENIVTVEEEVNNIREYAKIIEYRFWGKIDVNIQVSDQILKKEIIKLMLQPLVENAVFHGLEQKMDGGEVNVSIEQSQGGFITFVIEDNGCGIENNKLEQLRKNLNNQHGNKGIGLPNIYQRLRLFYNENMQFIIMSIKGHGTKVTIVVPDEVGVDG